MIAIFLKPLILRTLRARKIKGFRKMAKVLLPIKGDRLLFWSALKMQFYSLGCQWQHATLAVTGMNDWYGNNDLGDVSGVHTPQNRSTVWVFARILINATLRAWTSHSCFLSVKLRAALKKQPGFKRLKSAVRDSLKNKIPERGGGKASPSFPKWVLYFLA